MDLCLRQVDEKPLLVSNETANTRADSIRPTWNRIGKCSGGIPDRLLRDSDPFSIIRSPNTHELQRADIKIGDERWQSGIGTDTELD